MALVEILPAERAACADRLAVDSGLAQYGRLLHTWGAILHRPGLFAAYLPFLRAVAAPGSVDPRLKDASALLVGHLNGCRYTVSHRYASAIRNGATDELLLAVVEGAWSDLEPGWRCILELSRVMTLAPPQVPRAVAPQIAGADLLAEVRRYWSDEQVVELTMSISVWNALSRFHRVMGFELDMPAAPDGMEPE